MQKLERKFTRKGKGFFRFLCACGQTTILRGDTSATACQQKNCTVSTIRKHGYAHTRLYKIWDGMKNRCIGKHHSAKHYKDTGIKICNTWLEFENFKLWAESNGYADTLTIDRINIFGNYEPNNCEWVSRSENTSRQLQDKHPCAISICLNNTEHFSSIAKAARHIEKFTTTKFRSISAVIEKRIKQNSKKPYKGFIITKCSKEDI